jgi:UDP-glucose 4-epimerase
MPKGSNHKQTFLVTGSSGFLGSALVESLRARGHVVYEGIRSGRPSAMQRVCSLASSIEKWQQAIHGCDGVFHLAWSTVPGSANSAPLADAQTNVIGTLGLLEALRSQPNTKLLFASSGGTVYGAPGEIPIPETHALCPLGVYGASKVSAEGYIMAYRRQWGIDARIIRLSNPYGPGQNPSGKLGAATVFAARALADQPIEVWGDGDTVRDYLYIDDAITGCITAMDAASGCLTDRDPIFNIGSGQGISLNQIIATLESVLSKPIPVRYHTSRGFDVHINVLDISRATSILGWSPQVDFSSGLRRTVLHLKQHMFDIVCNDR